MSEIDHLSQPDLIEKYYIEYFSTASREFKILLKEDIDLFDSKSEAIAYIKVFKKDRSLRNNYKWVFKIVQCLV